MKVLQISSWKLLPWQKINNRVFALQEKIYRFSAQCNQENVYKLQDYMLNSSDIKLFAIQNTYKQIKQYYILRDKEQYILEDYDKKNIYTYLIGNERDGRNKQTIIRNIKQYLVYLCLKPEWEARFEPMHKFNINHKEKYYFIYRLSNFLSKSTIHHKKPLSIQNYSLNSQKTNKYINTYNLSCRLQALPSISYYLNFWVKNQALPEDLYISNNLYVKLKTGIDYLSHLLYNIIFNGFEWYSIIVFYYQRANNRLLSSIYSSFNKKTIFEVLTTYIFHSTISWKTIKSLYNIIAYYNRSFHYISVYTQQNSTEKKNILENFCNLYKLEAKCCKKFTIQANSISYKYLIRYIKKCLYHYDSINRLRPNTLINSSNAIIRIRNLILDFYKCHYPLINVATINQVLKLLDNILIKWLKKNNKNGSLVSTYKTYLNQQTSYLMSHNFV
uniref:Putative group II intron reverse transcriptase/maturase protein n=1 Tax=Eucheuma denticulatum TaxID=305493 RepID=A0A8E7PG97_9FLOR|nr:putative group II intron reverse transcriptase/maturase protein [Eucheuma denticulatum]